MNKRSRHFTFTNFSTDEKPEEKFPEYTYLIYQIEKCPKTGKLHQQGAVSFTYQKSMSALVKTWKGPHYEIAGNMLASRNYCKKVESRVEGPFVFEKKTSKDQLCKEYETYVQDIASARIDYETKGFKIDLINQILPIIEHKYFHVKYPDPQCLENF